MRPQHLFRKTVNITSRYISAFRRRFGLKQRLITVKSVRFTAKRFKWMLNVIDFLEYKVSIVTLVFDVFSVTVMLEVPSEILKFYSNYTLNKF